MPESVDRVREHFARADAATAALRATTALACPPGCGACCLSPAVETSMAEMLPMAGTLAREGRAEGLLEALAERTDPRCALYLPDAADPRRGRCGAYAERPLVCRLFGFAARRTRADAVELTPCRTMREGLGDRADEAAERAVREAARAVAAGLAAPVSADHAHALAADLPGEGVEQLPINEALRRALERVLLARRLAALEALAARPVLVPVGAVAPEAVGGAEGPPQPTRPEGPPLGSRPAA